MRVPLLLLAALLLTGCGADRTVRAAPAPPPARPLPRLVVAPDRNPSAETSPDGKLVAEAYGSEGLRLRRRGAKDPYAQSAPVPIDPYFPPDPIWSPDSRRVLLIAPRRRSVVIDARTGRILRRVGGTYGLFDRQLFSPDGRQLVQLRGNLVQIVDVATGAIRRTPMTLGAAWSPDGTRLASGGRIFDLRTSASRRFHPDGIPVWSPDSRRMAWLRDGTGGFLTAAVLELDVPGATPREVHVADPDGDGRGDRLRWSGDGRRLLVDPQAPV